MESKLKGINKETLWKYLMIILGTAITAFGMYNIHAVTDIKEGGVIGMVLLVNHHFNVPIYLLSLILDLSCFAIGFKFFGKTFLKSSIFAAFSLAFFLFIFGLFPPILPDLSEHLFFAAILGGLFIGIGVGIVVRQGAACGGDDAVCLVISKLTKMPISKAYLFSDISVLLLTLTYVPFEKLAFSLITVIVSSYSIQLIEQLGEEKEPIKLVKKKPQLA